MALCPATSAVHGDSHPVPANASLQRTVPQAGSELVIIRPAGEGAVKQRSGWRAGNHVVQITTLLRDLIAADAAIDRLAFRKSLEARADASVKALTNDLACYAKFCARCPGPGLPAPEARNVAYLEDCEARKLKPASVGRRLASLATIHGLLGEPSPRRGRIVRNALRGFRRRVDVRQRQAGPFGEGIGTEPAKGFTLKVALQARP